MLKVIGSIMLIVSGVMIGFMASRRLCMRVCFLESFLKFINFLSTEIRYTTNPLPTIFKKYKEGGFISNSLKKCVDEINNGLSVSRAWKRSIDCIPYEYGLSREDKSLMRDFGENLGSTDLEGQLSHCNLSIDLINVNLESAREEKKKKSKLYFMLGLFGGIAITLILC